MAFTRCIAGLLHSGTAIHLDRVCVRFPELALPAFHDGVKRLHDVRAVRLLPASEMLEPEHSIIVDGRMMYLVAR